MIFNPIVSGSIRLPELSNPAGAAQILSGYQAIGADGNVITGNIPSQGAQTITPGTTTQTAVASGRYTTGDVDVAGDANLVPENIAEGVSIFGVTGTHSGGTQLESVSLSVNITSGLYSNLYYYSIVDGYTTVSDRPSYDVTDCLKDSIVVFATSADTDIEISGDYVIIPIDSPGQRGFVCRGNVEMDVTATGPV